VLDNFQKSSKDTREMLTDDHAKFHINRSVTPLLRNL